MRALLGAALVATALWAGCGDDKKNNAGHDDAGTNPGSDASAGSDAGSDAKPFAFCLDRPDSIVPTPPTKGLPCELAPPSLTH